MCKAIFMLKSKLLLIVLTLFSITCYAENCPLILNQKEGLDWVEECFSRYPELAWLADEQVRKTEEGQRSTSQKSYSEQLFSHSFIEFDRTLMTLHCMKLIVDGTENAYAQFVQAQTQATRLSKASFQQLHQQAKDLLNSHYQNLSELEIAHTLETALILGDIGKTAKARTLFKNYDVVAVDHDDFYGEAMHVLQEHPKLCPSFYRLPEASKILLIKLANIAHYGHITHLEGSFSMFAKLKASELAARDPTALQIDLFVHLCDVAGALGHLNNRSSLAYTEETHKALQAMSKACFVLSNPSKKEEDAYQWYLTLRAQWLGLSVDKPIDRVLARVGAMLRLFEKSQGEILTNVLQQFDSKTVQMVIAQFDPYSIDPYIKTATYMPAVLVNLANNKQLGLQDGLRLALAVKIGLPFIAHVLAKHQMDLANKLADPEIPLCFNFIAKIAKTHPWLIKADNFYIDQEGNVLLNGVALK